ncbi:hypothetical protein yfred0001_16710 [Yersinia frederiksenii ATCC 33641]|nr:hypothetical protein yfred0001_16710 [Yersinia frederiksenii ATCC 33641]
MHLVIQSTPIDKNINKKNMQSILHHKYNQFTLSIPRRHIISINNKTHDMITSQDEKINNYGINE